MTCEVLMLHGLATGSVLTDPAVETVQVLAHRPPVEIGRAHV